MKVISFNTLCINYEKKYNPNSQILIDYPDDNKRLLDICEIILKNIASDTIICLQECSEKLLFLLNDKIDKFYSIFSQEIDEGVFMVTITHLSLSFSQEDFPLSKYERFAHGFLVVSNNNMKIVNCHLLPRFVAKGNVFSFIKDVSKDGKCIIAGDFNERYKNIVKNLPEYSVPYFGSTYKTNKGIDHIIFNFNADFTAEKLNTYKVSDHCAILVDL
jgi:hypothetical protein